MPMQSCICPTALVSSLYEPFATNVSLPEESNKVAESTPVLA